MLIELLEKRSGLGVTGLTSSYAPTFVCQYEIGDITAEWLDRVYSYVMHDVVVEPLALYNY